MNAKQAFFFFWNFLFIDNLDMFQTLPTFHHIINKINILLTPLYFSLSITNKQIEGDDWIVEVQDAINKMNVECKP